MKLFNISKFPGYVLIKNEQDIVLGINDNLMRLAQSGSSVHLIGEKSSVLVNRLVNISSASMLQLMKLSKQEYKNIAFFMVTANHRNLVPIVYSMQWNSFFIKEKKYFYGSGMDSSLYLKTLMDRSNLLRHIITTLWESPGFFVTNDLYTRMFSVVQVCILFFLCRNRDEQDICRLLNISKKQFLLNIEEIMRILKFNSLTLVIDFLESSGFLNHVPSILLSCVWGEAAQSGGDKCVLYMQKR